MITITADFNIADIEAYISQEEEAFYDEQVDALRIAGKSFVKRARAKTREEGGFGNITWNLRASIGYLLVKDSKVVESYFPPINKGEEGAKTGDEYAREIALLTDEPGDIVLILVAGMEYASYVQATDRDVIRGSTPFFEKEIKALFAA